MRKELGGIMAGYGASVPMTDIRDSFWGSFRDTLIREAIPYQWAALNDALPESAEKSGCMRNFRIAAGLETGDFHGFPFQDSDAYKWLEGVAYSLRWKPDPALEALADGAIETIVAAQQPDGYLDTCYIIRGLSRRWTNLRDDHELYVAGHLIEAAVAYWQTTGKRVLLDAAIRFADHIDSVIGPEKEKLHGYPGHPVLEMALMRLHSATGDERYLRLAAYFVRQRGRSPLFFEEERLRFGREEAWKGSPLGMRYYQSHAPLTEQNEAVGHAVRAMYLYSGMADVAGATGDGELAAACRRLWESAVRRRMYVTGALGSSEHGEAFTFDYDLPNDTVYGETCASVGLVFFARRMLCLEPRGEYADVMERALYNSVLSGMQLDGRRFFYVNPLEVVPEACRWDRHKSHVKPERQPWFGCACCPPNLVRLLASLEDYAAVRQGDTLYLNLYLGGTLREGGLALETETRYPWDGRVELHVTEAPSEERSLALRIPGWCEDWGLRLNGEPLPAERRKGYALLRRRWQAGDRLVLELELTPRWIRANPRVREDAGQVALQRGPIVYCLEETDNGKNLHLLRRGPDPSAETCWEPDTLGGVVTVRTAGLRETEDWPEDRLYDYREAPEARPTELKWIPYYAWANRSAGEMRVWIRE